MVDIAVVAETEDTETEVAAETEDIGIEAAVVTERKRLLGAMTSATDVA